MIKNLVYLNENIKSFENKDENKQDFLMYLIGKPGSGKTSVLNEMLYNEELLCSKFDYIFIFSPYTIPNLECVENENWFPEFSEDTINDILNVLKNEEKNNQINNILFIFDDVITKIRNKKNYAFFMNFIFNRRHLLKNSIISIIITSQRYFVLPAAFRSCLTHLILFQLNEKEYKILKDDCYGCIDIKNVKNNLISPHDFIFIDLQNSKLYKNFLIDINANFN